MAAGLGTGPGDRQHLVEGQVRRGQVRGRLGWKGLMDAAIESGRTTGTLFLILFGAMIFSAFINLSGFAGLLGEWVQGLGMERVGLLVAIAVLYLILGCVLETMSLMLLTVPIFLPLVTEMGVSPIWFGVFLILMIEIGQLTPPVGMNVLTVKSVVPDIPTGSIFRGTVPFLFFNLCAVGLIIAYPQIVMAPLRWLG